jgi:hypothetical protein
VGTGDFERNQAWKKNLGQIETMGYVTFREKAFKKNSCGSESALKYKEN